MVGLLRRGIFTPTSELRWRPLAVGGGAASRRVARLTVVTERTGSGPTRLGAGEGEHRAVGSLLLSLSAAARDTATAVAGGTATAVAGSTATAVAGSTATTAARSTFHTQLTGSQRLEVE